MQLPARSQNTYWRAWRAKFTHSNHSQARYRLLARSRDFPHLMRSDPESPLTTL